MTTLHVKDTKGDWHPIASLSQATTGYNPATARLTLTSGGHDYQVDARHITLRKTR